MVVCDFNIISVSAFPVKADSPLIVDPDTVLPLTVTLQGLKPVARRDSKVLKEPDLVEVKELSTCNPFNRAISRHIQVIEE
jgi:hypothetical protein